ncbi:Helicase conserved C-terminal domain-containing protein [Paenibacillus sp. 1_12]|uniref:DEAD/DEAH box helicase n=1 Tax=Paenibacillus sp. 1_12 TaxID=1566278 RepID=UPI0008E15F76|nr:helicase-related protein [Paenibacillus sp. 1_12]SFM51640.1 Helicase conserved C-terminal domain-containing protein [Paenibacillus sp. 1_12]
MTLAVDKKWINRLDPNEVVLYPLQFANTERLNNHGNDAVYIFDEVGSGKTISSGIMALDFLEHNPGEDVLVITANALARSSDIKPRGQFLSDWFDKLPFEELGYGNRVQVVNNHHSKFKTLRKYGLVIIDEAHLFLGDWTQRYLNLTNNIRAKKVVFLTATPIKQGKQDLQVYPRIASKLLEKPVDSSWIDQLLTIGKQPEALICSQFDVKFPVTRYFKDTIKSLETEGYNKTNVKRYESLVWQYQSRNNKNEILVKNLKAISAKSKNNRFVVFTRYVEKEVDVIAGYLDVAGFEKSVTELPDKPTYYVVTGRNPRELTDFSRSDNLPTVLILTYQIAEQGINLPGYNHIVNYHISAYPSALEQRYGRIDRLNSKSEEIFNCFLVGSNYFDTSSTNFLYAISTCLGSMLSYLPSRNTILSPDILNRYTTMKNDAQRYLTRLSETLEDQGVSELYDYLTAWEALQNKPATEASESEAGEVNLAEADSAALSEALGEASFDTDPVLADEDQNELFVFCRERLSLDQDLKASRDEAEKALLEDIQRRIDEFQADVSYKSDEKNKVIEWLSRNEGIWDHIFYVNERSADWTQLDVGRVDAVEGCAKFISANSDYVEYLKIFNEQIRLPKEFQKYRALINRGFEKAFEANRFDILFPALVNSTYSEKFKASLKPILDAKLEAQAKAELEAKLAPKPESNNKISDLVIDNIDQLIPTLPLFKLMELYKQELKKLARIENGALRDKFHGEVHVFATAMGRLRNSRVNVSNEFYNKYFGHVRGKEYFSFKEELKSFFEVAFTKEIVEAGVEKRISSSSNWLKLAYHMSRKESVSCLFDYVDGVKRLTRIIDTQNGIIASPNGSRSLFSHFIERNSRTGFRTWAQKYFVDDIVKPDYVWADDYWTKGVLREVKGLNYS